MEVIRNLPDTELVANLRAGKSMDESIKTIYRNHFESLCWYIMNNSGSRQDAEDVFQEVVLSFIDLVQKDKFRGESTVKTFLFSLNRHTWLNELKRRGRSLAREEKYERGQERTEMDAGHYIADREGKAEVTRLVGELGETCRKILLLFYYENLSMREILETLHYENEQVVRNKKYKCLKQLEQMITEKPYLKQSLKNLLHG
ncbi:MAG: sigma-70 family RNA polymerase sigma factor [Chitinophagaceae bacterium]|jgi:RNA polymerase sigma factor (sigma-70 family)|nr:sigma-70 family RNA polymerase sigma factor [Chitinophagaceae bacterium]